MGRCIVLLSGGIDSATALWLSKRTYDEVATLSIIYHRRNQREIEAARKLSSRIGAERHIECDATFLREVFDMDQKLKNEVSKLGIPTTYIPVRNAIFYSIAAFYSFIYNYDVIIAAHNKDDVSVFPDVSKDFIESFNGLLRRSIPSREIRVNAPLLDYTKDEVFKLALELNVPLEDTWSCWATYEAHCGSCPGCENRRRLFSENNITDPTRYLTDSTR